MWRSTSLLGLELKDDVLKIVELSRNGRGVRLERFLYERIPDGWVSEGVLREPEQLSEFARNAVNREMFQTNKVHLSIDSPSFLLQKKTYPPMKKRDLRKVIAFEVEEQMELPFHDPWYEVVSLRQPDKKDNGAEWEVLLVLTSEAFVRTYVEFARSSGLKPVGVDLSPLAIHRWLKYARPQDELGANVLVANLSTQKINVSVFEEDVLVTACCMPLAMDSFRTGGISYRDRDIFPDYLHEEDDVRNYAAQLAAKLDSFLHLQQGEKIGELVLTGEGAPLFQIRHVLSETLGTRTTVLSGEITVGDSLTYQPVSRIKPGLCLPMGLALKGLVRL